MRNAQVAEPLRSIVNSICPIPKCDRPVLRVVQQPSTTLYVHAAGKLPAQIYGCAVSAIRKDGK